MLYYIAENLPAHPLENLLRWCYPNLTDLAILIKQLQNIQRYKHYRKTSCNIHIYMYHVVQHKLHTNVNWAPYFFSFSTTRKDFDTSKCCIRSLANFPIFEVFPYISHLNIAVVK